MKEQNQTHPKIPGVHLKRISHVLADTHELAQDERRALRALLRDHELHRGRVHPVPEGRDHTEVCSTEQGVEFVLSERLVAVGSVTTEIEYNLDQARTSGVRV